MLGLFFNRKLKGSSVSWGVVAIVTTALSLLAIGLTAEVVGGLAQESGISSDTGALEDLGSAIRTKCSASYGSTSNFESRVFELEMTVAEELRSGDDSLEMVFSDTSRTVDLGSGCENRFDSGAFPLDGPGIYSLNVSYEGRNEDGNPVILVEES